jgi:hypothetical protein
LLHDASGHPLLITTHRGDQHLTSGLPTVIRQYEQEAGLGTVRYLVVDREAMAAEFLAALKETGRTAISVLRTDQYGGLDSFTDSGAFVPLRVSKQGDVLREVAPASIALPLPFLFGQVLQLRVALRPFNDKRYNQDLEALCERVNAVAPRLPDGRHLHVSVQTNAPVRPILDMQKRRVA